MAKRGPKSAAALMTTAVSNASTVHRPEPPNELWRDEETEVWRAVVEALPSDWFDATTTPLLTQYCRHVVQARRIAQVIRQHEHGENGLDVDDWLRLIRAQDQQSAAIARLATKMRLSQQSSYGPRAADTAKRDAPAGNKLWEFE